MDRQAADAAAPVAGAAGNWRLPMLALCVSVSTLQVILSWAGQAAAAAAAAAAGGGGGGGGGGAGGGALGLAALRALAAAATVTLFFTTMLVVAGAAHNRQAGAVAGDQGPLLRLLAKVAAGMAAALMLVGLMAMALAL